MAQSKVPTEVAKFASLSMVWGVVALASYLFLPWVNKPNTPTALFLPPWESNPNNQSGFNFAQALQEKGLSAFTSGNAGGLSDPRALALFLLILLIPVAAVGVVGTGLLARLRVPGQTLVRSHIAIAVVGLAGTLAMFIPYVVEDTNNQVRFAKAVGIIALTSIIARSRQRLQKAFQRNPAVVSILGLGLGYVVIRFADEATLTTIMLAQAGLWFTLASFLLVIYSGTHLGRETRRARRSSR